MGDAMVGRYWCYICSQMVNPTSEPAIKCPLCESGFVEEMSSIRHYPNTNGIDLASVNNLSLLVPILLCSIGGLGGLQLRIAGRDQINDNNSSQDALGDEFGSEFEALLRRRRSSALENPENGRERNDIMILSDPFNDEALIAQASYGDYLIGQGWDLLLQYFSENNLSRYGTPPALKEAIEAMPNVTMDDNLQCSICLEDIKIGCEAKEMPCKHKFHNGCITPWLEHHSSCPVCRFQLPWDDSRLAANFTIDSEGRVGIVDVRSGNRLGTGRRYWIPIPLPYDRLLALPGSQSGSASASSSEAMPGSESSPQTDGI
ncbi:hypothetical protein Goshw_011409 [Gossypium schwendimanii]|uniref:RING-type E3 ubiquitin transferase n=1 Tax=Gossypium schwendimanii TaxID=34291 RepID=A0A7J9LM80_GOSSC|nr:hypothetical protein [Gossypium schwendimanii]